MSVLCHPITVDQVVVGFRLRGDHQDNVVDVGGNGLECPEVVGPLQQCVAVAAGHNHAGAVTAWPPDDLVAGHQAVDIGPYKAAQYFPGVFPLEGFHVKLLAIMGNNQSLLFLAQVAGIQLLTDGFLFLRRPRSPFLLDFLDAPLLLLVKSTFSHIVGRSDPGGE